MAETPNKYDLIRKGDLSCSRCLEREEEFQALAEQHHAKIGELVVAHREEVKGLREQIAELENKENGVTTVDVTKTFPRQHPATARCIVCGVNMFTRASKGSPWVKSYNKDDRFCAGKRWWRFWRSNCAKTAHLHKYCGYCKAQWVERPY